MSLEVDVLAQKDFILKRAIGLDKKIEASETLRGKPFQDGLLEMIKFLNLIAEFKQILTPSLFVDLIWHEFILFTKTYTEFCDHYYDKYIHHHPGGSDDENQRQYLKTLKLYEMRYGQPNLIFWPGCENVLSSCGSCSSEGV